MVMVEEGDEDDEEDELKSPKANHLHKRSRKIGMKLRKKFKFR